MTVYISLLRGINVGGSKVLSMDTLCELYIGLGYHHVRTYLQSGNVVFHSPMVDQSSLVSQIESAIQRLCGYSVQVFIRQPQDVQPILQNNPFLARKDVDASKLHVAFLYRAPAEAAWSQLSIPHNIPDQLVRRAMEIYLYYPNGFSKAKISTAYLEKVLGVPITARNWNTVNALYKIALD